MRATHLAVSPFTIDFRTRPFTDFPLKKKLISTANPARPTHLAELWKKQQNVARTRTFINFRTVARSNAEISTDQQ